MANMVWNPHWRKVTDQQSPNFLAPGTGVMEDNFSMDWGQGGNGFRMIPIKSGQPGSLSCAVHSRIPSPVRIWNYCLGDNTNDGEELYIQIKLHLLTWHSPPQFSSVAQLYPTLCDHMDHSTPGLPVKHQLLEFTQTHVHWVGDAVQGTLKSLLQHHSSQKHEFFGA